jgi:hypothetical protein
MKPMAKANWIFLILLLVAAAALTAQNTTNQILGTEKPGSSVERFRLRNGKFYEGIWDPQKPQIHIVNKTNHIANLSVATNDVVKREVLRDGSDIKILTDLQMAQRVVEYQLQALKTAKARVIQANQNRTTLHQTYHGKNLPTAQYNAVMKQYQAADEAITIADKAVAATQTAFDKAFQNYQQLGGKTDYHSQIH